MIKEKRDYTLHGMEMSLLGTHKKMLISLIGSPDKQIWGIISSSPKLN